MAVIGNTVRLVEETAEFLASSPTLDQLLNYRPSEEVQQRVRELLASLKLGQVSEEEQRELDRYENVEMLMQMVKAKARLRAGKTPKRSQGDYTQERDLLLPDWDAETLVQKAREQAPR